MATPHHEGKSILYAFGAGFLFCLVLLWMPAHEALQHSREWRENDIDWIRTELLSPAQREKLSDFLEERADFDDMAEQQDARTRQPQAK